MVRGEASIVKCHYKGKTEDFVIFVDDVESAEKWKTDKSIPLAQVVSSFKVFVSKYVVYLVSVLFVFFCSTRVPNYPSLGVQDQCYPPIYPTTPLQQCKNHFTSLPSIPH